MNLLHNLRGFNLAQLVGVRIYNLTDAEEATLAGLLGPANDGLPIWNVSASPKVLKIWDGTQFIAIATSIDGDVVFKGTLDASLAIDDPGQPQAIEPVKGYQYKVTTAGTFDAGATGVTLSGNQQLEVGDIVLFTSTTTATSFQRNDTYATETEEGNIRLATLAEVLAGTEATEAVTPATLQAKLDGQQYTRGHFDPAVDTTALTPKTISHGLNLVHKDAFTINIMDASGSQVAMDVDSVDVNNLTITTILAHTGLRVTVTGVCAAA